ncbi:MAG TPA: restriction endonuclease subunit S, partial [Bacteroidetes bacterium]|nr:restriction endonuclease subunit S [Bacteroidota bacterium]
MSESGIPEGFKTTELCGIPEEWKVVRLGEVAKVKYGKANPKDTGNIPVVGSGGIYSSTTSPLVDYPTIIIGRKGTAGKAWLFLRPCYPSDTTFYLEWKKDIDVSFLFNYLVLNPLSGEHAKTTLPSLQKPDLENYLIPLPPLSEQHRIAAVLSAVQDANYKTGAVIAAAKSLKKSLMRHLFTYGPVPAGAAESVPLAETEIGLVPE